MFNAIGEGHKIMQRSISNDEALQQAYAADPMQAVIDLHELAREANELEDRVRELEGRIAELAKENSGHKRVIHILENKVLELKGKLIPMEPRLPTCDALCRPRHILQSNRSNAKEAGNES
jgi:predicted nuclease with TOPRIM domain